MPNPLYNKGVRKERKIVNSARARGLVAFRSAGSHSPIDVCVIDKDNKKILFFQCKPDNISQKKKEFLENELKYLNDVWQASFEVV